MRNTNRKRRDGSGLPRNRRRRYWLDPPDAERHIGELRELTLTRIRLGYFEPEARAVAWAALVERLWAHACWLDRKFNAPCDHGKRCDHQGGDCPRGEVLPQDAAAGVRTCQHIKRISGLSTGVLAAVNVLERQLATMTGSDISAIEPLLADLEDAPLPSPTEAAAFDEWQRGLVSAEIDRIEQRRRASS